MHSTKQLNLNLNSTQQKRIQKVTGGIRVVEFGGCCWSLCFVESVLSSPSQIHVKVREENPQHETQ
eukprot:CAMPEP_0202466366 /NCGR_PEP_ID=MMETSP1360-20130828/68554_1 /ASSEMBLY_ACC=CAM_ASM_000848 /TAXON_ID=515479 /ORGANISM="Licmophora paradoxa, Strain CCMP2313" /LENGTH=65 /DNA_ID=CAMNT_0049090477 /DNA_START=261 /DNA_END=455 /DNA_ORIENTATION=+